MKASFLFLLLLCAGCQPIILPNQSVFNPTNLDFCKNQTELLASSNYIQESFICYLNYYKLHGNSSCSLDSSDICGLTLLTQTGDKKYCSYSNRTCNTNERNYTTCLYNMAPLGGPVPSSIESGDECFPSQDCSYEIPDCSLVIGLTSETSEKCSQFNQTDRELCLLGVAISQGDLESCKQIPDYQEICEFNVNSHKALDKNDVEACLSTGGYIQGECASRIAIQRKDESICEQLGFGKYQCYLAAAIAKNDRTLCFKLPGPMREDCERKTTFKEPVNDCSTLSPDKGTECYLLKLCQENGIKDDCYNVLNDRARSNPSFLGAIHSNDSAKCGNISGRETGGLKELCQYRQAQKLGFTLFETFKYGLTGQDEQICEKLTEDMQKKCFFNLAIRKQETYCRLTGEYEGWCKWHYSTRMDSASTLREKIVTDESIVSTRQDTYADYNYLGQVGYVTVTIKNPTIDPKKLRLYFDHYLVDIDGCDSLISCKLEFPFPASFSYASVVYENKSISGDYVNPGMTPKQSIWVHPEGSSVPI